VGRHKADFRLSVPQAPERTASFLPDFVGRLSASTQAFIGLNTIGMPSSVQVNAIGYNRGGGSPAGRRRILIAFAAQCSFFGPLLRPEELELCHRMVERKRARLLTKDSWSRGSMHALVLSLRPERGANFR
jgi:hypothetical protein